MKSFKYFDLNGNGVVDLQEFIKVIEKIGVIVQSVEEVEAIFNVYDADHSGALDYNEFAAILFGNKSATTRARSPERGAREEAKG